MNLEQRKEHFTKWFNLWINGTPLQRESESGEWIDILSPSERHVTPPFYTCKNYRIKPRQYEVGKFYPVIHEHHHSTKLVVRCTGSNGMFILRGIGFPAEYFDWIGEALPDSLWNDDSNKGS